MWLGGPFVWFIFGNESLEVLLLLVISCVAAECDNDRDFYLVTSILLVGYPLGLWKSGLLFALLHFSLHVLQTLTVLAEVLFKHFRRILPIHAITPTPPVQGI